MALYLDTSCALKLLWDEAETTRTVAFIQAEDRAVVSDLTWLECLVRIQGRHAAGLLTRKGALRLSGKAEVLFATPPFERQRCPASLISEAALQVSVGDRRSHCRTLDRIHLAAMSVLGLKRLLTNDDAQARAARSQGLTVLVPR